MGRKRRGAPSRKVASARRAASDKSDAALRIRVREFCPQRRALGTMRSRRHWGYKKITLRTAAPWWRLSAGRRWALSRSGRGFRRAMTAFPKIVCLCRGERLTATEANSDAQIDSENRRVEGAVKSICKGCRSAIIKDPAPAPFQGSPLSHANGRLVVVYHRRSILRMARGANSHATSHSARYRKPRRRHSVALGSTH